MKITTDLVGQNVKAYDLAEYETFVIEVEGKRLQIVRSKLAGMTPGRLSPSNIKTARRHDGRRRKQIKTHLSLEQKKEAVAFAKKHSMKEAAAKFNVHPDSVRNWMLGRSLATANGQHVRSRKAS